jgi:phosphomannomutase/phosphoglucomutase
MKIFRAYDVRGVYPKEIDERTALRMGKALGTFNPGKIVVGNDSRLSGPSLKRKLIEGLISTGCDVVDIGMAATPMIIFSTMHLKCDGGVMVTASHNPKEFNGFKFNGSDGIPISFESGLNKIEEIFEIGEFSQQKGSVSKIDLTRDYAEFLLLKVSNLHSTRMKIVVDAGNGSPGSIYPKILRETGVDICELYCEPDGNFPNHQPDPSKRENMRDLQRRVLETQANLGFAYDGDGDRLGVVDENGNIVDPNRVFALLIKQTLESRPNSKIVYDVLSSMMIEDTIRKHNGVPIVSKVGHTYIAQRMAEEDAALGGELSGHYYFEEIFCADDALFASIKLIELLTKSNREITDHLKDLPKYHSQVSEAFRFPISESEKFSFMKNLEIELREKGYKINTLDGVKIAFEDGWALLRLAHTESKISVAYESRNQEGFTKIKKFVDEIVRRIPQ